MRLSCQKAFLFAAALTLACHESTAPPSISSFYVLESVNGQPLPVTVQAGEYATTVIWSNLSLDVAGNAILVQRIRQVHLNAAIETTGTSRYSYTVTGDSVGFDYSPPCPPNALCIGPPFGKLDGSTLTLFVRNALGLPAYRYRPTLPAE